MPASGNYIVESDVDNWPVSVSATCTFSNSDINLGIDAITITEDVPTGTLIRFTSTETLPSPLVYGQEYYAIRVDATHIKVATNPVNAAAETQIDLTDKGTGIHTLDIGNGSGQADRQETIDRAEQLIENITRDYFYSKAFAMYFDGNANDKLFLGLTPDILTVTEILISGIALGTSWWTYNTDSVYLDPEASTGDELPELLLRLKYKRKIFPRGMGNIKITGTYGWPSRPVAIKRAAIILCRYENDDTLYTVHTGNLKSEKLGDYSYTLADGAGAENNLTGIDEVDKLIGNYIRRKPIMGVV